MKLITSKKTTISQQSGDYINGVSTMTRVFTTPTTWMLNVTQAVESSATVSALTTRAIDVSMLDDTKTWLLDASVNGAGYFTITQSAAAQVLNLKGTSKVPARFVINLKAPVTAIMWTSEESTNDTTLRLLIAELPDITDADNFEKRVG